MKKQLIEEINLRKFFSETRKIKEDAKTFFLLEHEKEMIERIKQEKRLQNRFIRENDGIAWHVARKYYYPKMRAGVEDLVQEARIGIFSGIVNYEYQCEFLAHIFTSANSSVLSFLKSLDLMKISPTDLSNYKKINNLESEMNEEATEDDIEELLEIKPDKIREARLAGEMINTASLDSPIKDGEAFTLMELLVDERADMPNKLLEDKLLYRSILRILEEFSEQEKDVFLFQFKYGFSFKEACEMLNVKPDRGKRIQQRIFERIGEVYV